MSIRLYAELLLHIKSISIHGAITLLPGNDDNGIEDTAVLEALGPNICVSHGNLRADLRLPVRIIGATTSTLRLAAQEPESDRKFDSSGTCVIGSLEGRSAAQRVFHLAARLALSEDEVAHYLTLSPLDGALSEECTPWSALQLSAGTTISCLDCGKAAVSGTVQEWRDLPRDGWNEMMDFWHCHKPIDLEMDAMSQHDSDGSYHKGALLLEMKPNIGLVDPTSFLLHSDATEVEMQTIKRNNTPIVELACGNCLAILGVVDPQSGGHRIRKHLVVLQNDRSRERTSFALEKWVTSRILAMAEGQSTKRFVVTKETSKANAVGSVWLIWVLLADFYFCTASADQGEANRNDPDGSAEAKGIDSNGRQCSLDSAAPSRAAKVLYQKVEYKDDVSQPLEPYEELELPELLHAELERCLQTNANLLPRSAQTMGPWSVSLLRRFELADVDPIRADKSDQRRENTSCQ